MRSAMLGLVLLGFMSGCDTPQSALAPAGEAAQRIANLFYWMVGGAVMIWLTVVGLAIYALCANKQHERRLTTFFVIGGGAVFPTVVLTGLLSYGLQLLPELNRPAPEGSLTIEVRGVRWWWRVHYLEPEQAPLELANEIVLPVGQPVEFKLLSEDVIHSFWIPSLGGKVDMLPGRENRLKLMPTRAGVYRGVCAEYCGTAHAQMAFAVRVVSPDEFSDWLANQRTTARPPTQPVAIEGAEIFNRRGCGACHAVRGTPADGTVGPDLTHVGSRRTLAAGILENNVDQLRRWLLETHQIKPGVEMPQFDTLTDAQADALARYLEQLK